LFGFTKARNSSFSIKGPLGQIRFSRAGRKAAQKIMSGTTQNQGDKTACDSKEEKTMKDNRQTMPRSLCPAVKAKFLINANRDRFASPIPTGEEGNEIPHKDISKEAIGL
jgi:hypothetical protein